MRLSEEDQLDDVASRFFESLNSRASLRFDYFSLSLSL